MAGESLGVRLYPESDKLLEFFGWKPNNVKSNQITDLAIGVPQLVAAPATATSAGVAGQTAYDATHIYVCVTTNTWVRASLATF
jgi:hypothetical protein